MYSIPPKSKLRFMAHNPTGELIWVLTKRYQKSKSRNDQKIFKLTDTK